MTLSQSGEHLPKPIRILLINGSLGGPSGNTNAILQPLISCLAKRSEPEVIHLATDPRTATQLESLLLNADGFVFATGTYWDSWGSPLQRFFEQATYLEASATWLGKPVAVVVTMHSVGGKGVLSRLQGILSTLGLLIPPMTGFAYSLAGHMAMSGAPNDAGLADFWQLDDCEVVAHNLLEAATGGRNWRTWIVDKRDPHRRWFDGIPS